MQISRMLIGLLLVASLILDLAIGSAVFQAKGPLAPMLPVRIAFAALLVSQVSLIAAWSVFGKTRFLWRGLGAILSAATAGQVLGRLVESEWDWLVPIWTVLLFAQSAGIAVAISVAQRRGMRLVGPQIAEKDSRQASAERPQFSLASLLSLITLVAMTLGTLRYTFGRASTGFPPKGFWLAVLVASAAISGLSLVILYAVLRKGRPVARGVLVVSATPLAVLVLWSTGKFGNWPLASEFCLIQTFWMAAMLAVFRVAGWRVEGGGSRE